MAKGVAFVTGASRGVGAATAIALAEAGYDIAVSARTVDEGDTRDHSPTQKQSDIRPLPGSLEATAARVKRTGRRVLIVPADLSDRASLKSAVATVLAKWGQIDVLVNAGQYIGAGEIDLIADTPLELIDAQLETNLMAPITLIKSVLPQMLARNAGIIISVTSDAAYRDPDLLAGAGGWSLGHAISKGGVHRVAGVLATELGDAGIRAYNVQPGLIATERMLMDGDAFGLDTTGAAPPEVVGRVIAWLCTAPEAARFNGRNIEAQEACAELGLLPGWSLVQA